MGWALSEANLTATAKGYLAALGACGNERQAAQEVGVNDALVRAWSRDQEFVEHRRLALAHYASWQDWTPPRQHAPADQWPSAIARLDQRHDPCRIAYDVDQLLGRDRP